MEEIPGLYDIINICGSGLLFYTFGGYNWLYNYVSPMIESICILIFTQYVSLYHTTKSYFEYTYDTYPIVRGATNELKLAYDMLHASYYSYHTEPPVEPWLCVVFINKNNLPERKNNPYTFIEDYSYFLPYENENEIDETSYYNEYLEEAHDAANNIIDFESIYESIIVMNVKNTYYYRILYNTQRTFEPITAVSNNCDSHFLTIQYCHPKQKITIDIQFDKRIYIIGNEILSPTFVLRYLEYQSIPFYFDKDYTIDIMDTNINMFTLTSNEYICLEKDTYKIKKLQ